MSRGLSVKPISVRAIMYVFRLNVGARHFPSHCTTIFVIVVENILRGEGVIYVTMQSKWVRGSIALQEPPKNSLGVACPAHVVCSASMLWGTLADRADSSGTAFEIALATPSQTARCQSKSNDMIAEIGATKYRFPTISSRPWGSAVFSPVTGELWLERVLDRRRGIFGE